MVRALEGRLKIATTFIAFLMGAYNVYTLTFTVYDLMAHMALNLTFVLPLVYILYPARKKDVSRVPWYDYVLAVISAIPPLLLYLNYSTWVYGRWYFITELPTEQFVLGLIFLITIIEAIRRCAGLPMMLVALSFLVYLYLGPYIPPPLRHRGLNIVRIVEANYVTGAYGIFSIPLQVISTYVIAFTILGAVFSGAGVGKFFIDLAKALVGRVVGGPAKIAVIASSLFGTISGSAPANVYGTGIITIPTMKSLGYPPRFAGAVEAVASTGGQIMPPVMGAAAFVMAELLNVPYARIMIAAIIPALLYYLGVYVQVHYYSVRKGLKGLPKEEIPNLKKLMVERGYMLIPMAVLVYIVAVMMWSPVTAAFIAMFITIALSYIKKETRMTPKKIYIALAKGAEDSLTIIVCAAAAGIVVGAVALTGLSDKLTVLIYDLSLGSMALALMVAAIVTLIMGMALPTTAAYLVVVALAAPALYKLGVNPFQAHFFVFYYATISAITPPVALAAYAAASIARDDPMRVGFQACKLGIAAIIVPFVLIFKPGLLLVLEEPPLIIIENIVTAFIAIYAIALGVEGYMRDVMHFLERIALIAGGLVLFAPTSLELDLIGLILIASSITSHYMRHRRIHMNSTETRGT
ncbi:MAG: TRAP transporter fused permease subunit [Sulfolobales archaeon]